MPERGGPIDPDRWRQIKAIFERAVEQPADARIAFIERSCGDDHELKAEVLSLLETDLEGTEFLELPRRPRESSPASGSPADPSIDTGGRYRIVRKIGEGGMGEVYEAEQREPVRRRVALKVIKRGMDTREVIARFESERQALAVMNHRSIARVYDAGETSQGRPYFAMEYVDGLPITDYCDRHRLTPRQRLELFREVCAAVQHAHQKGVIHRDLKPSNLMIKVEGGSALPKVIDFGVSKAISRRLTEQSLFTQVGQWVGTPEYMSPEQADVGGIDVDTRTDVYSLGVVLYELLVGAKPFDPETLRRIALDEVRRVIREQDPPRPSTRVTTLGDASAAAAEARRLDPPTLRRSLRGDLDAIIMKALEKDRARRYGSPSELAADLERHLQDQPVLATPPSAWYRMRKFVRRHRFGAAAALLLSLSLLGGITATLWQARRAHEARERAEKRFNDVRALANSFIFEVYDAIEELPGATQARKLVVERALEYLDDLARESGGDPELLRELAGAYVRVGDVQGAPFHANLGDYTGAAASYGKAIEILESLRPTTPSDPELLAELSRAHVRLGRMSLTDGGVETAREHFQKAKDLLTDTPRLDSGLVTDLTYANEGVGVIFEEKGDYRSALPIYLDNLELERAALERTPTDLHSRRSLGIAHGRVAELLEAQLDARGAAEHLRKSIPLLESVLEEDPFHAGVRRELAVDKQSLGEALGALGAWTRPSGGWTLRRRRHGS